MINRVLTVKILNALKQLPVVTITGPRQSGKTTLVKSLPGDFEYINLENPDTREFAIVDPVDFLEKYAKDKCLIIDEAQYAPDLFSYIQVISDNRKVNGQFILTGSQNFLLLEKISHSLAGRTAIFELLPFSFNELKENELLEKDYELMIYKGGYPRLYRENADIQLLMNAYIRTYIERDLRQLINIKDLFLFQKFLKACASRTARLLNYSSIANEIGIDHKTVSKWISVLKASYIIYLLPPFYKNLNKRIVKSPKLYFVDTGIATSLLGIKNSNQLANHPLKGELFENLIVSELIKHKTNQGNAPDLYFWKDSTGNEVDIIDIDNEVIIAYEIKSAKTIHSSFFISLLKYKKMLDSNLTMNLVYGGNEKYQRKNINIIPWNLI